MRIRFFNAPFVSATAQSGAVLVEMIIAFPVFVVATILLMSLCSVVTDHSFAQESLRFSGRTIALTSNSSLEDSPTAVGCKSSLASLLTSRLALYGMNEAAVTTRISSIGGLRGLQVEATFAIDCFICPYISWFQAYTVSSFFPLENQNACAEPAVK